MNPKNCLTCKWRGPAKTPGCCKDPAYAATCYYPLPSLTMIDFNIGDVRRHINLATITPESPWFNSHHAAHECTTWAALENQGEGA